MIACINLIAEAEVITIKLKLYPIMSDNLQTAFQSRPVNEQEMSEVAQLLRNHSLSTPIEMFDWKSDLFGYFFEIPIW